MITRVVDTIKELAVSVEKAKEYCLVTHDHQDALLLTLIKSATSKCQKYARYYYFSTNIEVTAEMVGVRRCPVTGEAQGIVDPDGIYPSFRILHRPFKSVTSVKVLSVEEGTETSVPPEHYFVREGRVFWRKSFFAEFGGADYVVINYIVGNGDTPEELERVSPDLQEAVLLTVRHAFDRGDVDVNNIPPAAMALLNQFWDSPTYS